MIIPGFPMPLIGGPPPPTLYYSGSFETSTAGGRDSWLPFGGGEFASSGDSRTGSWYAQIPFITYVDSSGYFDFILPAEALEHDEHAVTFSVYAGDEGAGFNRTHTKGVCLVSDGVEQNNVVFSDLGGSYTLITCTGNLSGADRRLRIYGSASGFSGLSILFDDWSATLVPI